MFWKCHCTPNISLSNSMVCLVHCSTTNLSQIIRCVELTNLIILLALFIGSISCRSICHHLSVGCLIIIYESHFSERTQCDIVNHIVVGAAHEDRATNCNNYLNKYVKKCAYIDNGINGAISHVIDCN